MQNNYISTKQLAPKLSISIAEIRDCCELLGNPVIQQDGDREVVPDFTMPNGETISAEQFFNMLLQAAPVKDGKKDVLTAAIALKEQIEQANQKNQRPSPGNNPTSQLPESERLQFLEFVSARTGVPVSQIESLEHQSLEGQLLNYLKSTPEIAAQIHHAVIEFTAVQVSDRLKNGTPTDPHLLSRAEKEGLGKSNGEVHNPTEIVALNSVEQAMSGFTNFVNFSAPIHQPTFVSHLAASPTSPALPPEK
jgi:hypothetical protein